VSLKRCNSPFFPFFFLFLFLAISPADCCLLLTIDLAGIAARTGVLRQMYLVLQLPWPAVLQPYSALIIRACPRSPPSLRQRQMSIRQNRNLWGGKGSTKEGGAESMHTHTSHPEHALAGVQGAVMLSAEANMVKEEVELYVPSSFPTLLLQGELQPGVSTCPTSTRISITVRVSFPNPSKPVLSLRWRRPAPADAAASRQPGGGVAPSANSRAHTVCLCIYQGSGARRKIGL
jgi:hypothetical protein